MLQKSLLQYIRENSNDLHDQLPSFLDYLKMVTIFGVDKKSSIPKISRDMSYQDFINALISDLALRRSLNILVSGYKITTEDRKVSLPCINHDGNFLATYLNNPNWHKIFTLIGPEKFLDLLINYRGILQNSNEGKIQIFGEVKSFIKSTTLAPSYIPKWIYKFDVLYVSRRLRYRDFEIIQNDIQTILGDIVSACIKNPNQAKPAIKKRFRGIKSLLSRIISNDKKCRYDIIFNNFLSQHTSHQKSIVTDSSTQFNRVVDIVLIIMGKLFPLDAWGGAENKKIIKDRIVDFLRLGAGERLHLEDILKGIKLQKFTWLGSGGKIMSKQDFHIRKSLLEGYMYWVFQYLVKNIVRAFWYVTELSNLDHMKLFYFTHEIWNELSHNWITKYTKRNLVKVEPPETKEKFIYGKMRLIPKRDSFRVVCVPLRQSLDSFNDKRNYNLKQKEKLEYLQYQKNVLRPVRQILQLKLNSLRKSDMGHRSSVNSANEVAELILTFRNRLLKKHDTLPVLYMMKFDMKECYDRLNQDALEEAIEELFKGEQDHTTYHVREYASLDEFHKLKKQTTSIDTEVHNLNIVSDSSIEIASTRPTVDRVRTLKILKYEILNVCRSQIEDATCLIKNKENQYDLYKRKRGVFQGFSLLSIFCDILYSSMVVKEFKFLWDSADDSLLVRLVDDFLFITSSYNVFEQVKDKVSSNDLRKYGAYVNLEKTVVINAQESIPSCMKFVGLGINPINLDVRKDSSQFTKPTYNYRSFKALFINLKQFYCSNLSDYSLDFSSNSLETIIDNVNDVLSVTFEAIQVSFLSISKQDTFQQYRFMKFLYVIIGATIDKFMRVNDSGEGVQNLLTCIKVTITKALGFMTNKQEIIEWLYTLNI